MKRLAIVLMSLAVSVMAAASVIPKPNGIYVLDDNSNGKPASTVYASGLATSPAYQNDVTGHAIFVPIAKILPSITAWGQFNWDWSYLDTLVQMAVSHGKKFSIELETGYQNSSAYLHSLPAGFLAAAGANSAPLFNVWTVGGAQARGISAYVLLPWVPKVQEFWNALAYALAAHLQQTGVYGSLTLVHVPGLSIYDEELRLPTGFPRPTAADTLPCPDGRPAYPSVIDDADSSRWRNLGYSDSAVVTGFKVIATSFAQAFPDRYLGLSLLPPGAKGIDFPNFTADSVGTVVSEIVRAVNLLAPGRVELQADMLDANAILPEVISLASQYTDLIGWQSNKHGGIGAGCDGGGAGSCNPDGPTSPYFHLLENGSQNGGEYVEVWSADAVSYPKSFSAARLAGFYGLTGVSQAGPAIPISYNLEQNYPNPFNPTTMIRYQLPEASSVRLAVFDILGREVSVLVNEKKDAGVHEVKFDGSGLASGVYVYRLSVTLGSVGQAGDFVQTKKLLLVR